MSLFKREPRTVYRVYGEDEYFGHDQPADVDGLKVTPAVDGIGTPADEGLPPAESERLAEAPPLAVPAGAVSQWEPAPLPYRGPERDLRPLAVGLLATAVIGVLALVAVATLGRSSSRAPRAAAVTAPAPGFAEVRGGGAATGAEKSGAGRASRARTRVRARVETTTRVTSLVGRSQFGSSRARVRRLRVGAGRTLVSFAGARPVAVAPAAAGLADRGGEANAGTPASQATAEFGFER